MGNYFKRNPSLNIQSLKDENVEGIPILDLKQLFQDLKDFKLDEINQDDIHIVKRYKPITNYKLTEIPCSTVCAASCQHICSQCDRPHRPRHYHYSGEEDLRYSIYSVAEHIQFFGLTSNCIVYFTPTQKQKIEKLWNEIETKTKLF